MNGEPECELDRVSLGDSHNAVRVSVDDKMNGVVIKEVLVTAAYCGIKRALAIVID